VASESYAKRKEKENLQAEDKENRWLFDGLFVYWLMFFYNF